MSISCNAKNIYKKNTFLGHCFLNSVNNVTNPLKYDNLLMFDTSAKQFPGVINRLCDKIISVFPEKDVYRIGGDEFVVILTDDMI